MTTGKVLIVTKNDKKIIKRNTERMLLENVRKKRFIRKNCLLERREVQYIIHMDEELEYNIIE